MKVSIIKVKYIININVQQKSVASEGPVHGRVDQQGGHSGDPVRGEANNRSDPGSGAGAVGADRADGHRSLHCHFVRDSVRVRNAIPAA